MESTMLIKTENDSSKSSHPSSLQPTMSVHTLNMELATSQGPMFVKPEDLNNPSFVSPGDLSAGTPTSTSSMSESRSDSKTGKKRKSWGQELPEPTTNLPPRKRAKTEAEKEQRRIERVKRNRQAAHNSRERKRLEHELLETEKHKLAHNNALLRQQLVHCQAVIDALRTGQPEPAEPQPLAYDAAFYARELSTTHDSPTSMQNTPQLSNFTSPPSEAAPYTPELPVSHDLQQTQQSAVSLGVNGLDKQVLNDPLVAGDDFNMGSYFNVPDEDFCLFGEEPKAEPNHNITPFIPPSNSPLGPDTVLGAPRFSSTLDDPFGDVLFPNVHFGSGASFECDDFDLAAGEERLN